MSTVEKDLARVLAEWRKDPVVFVRQMFDVEPDAWQKEAMRAVARGDRGVSVRSGHGVGKTAFLSWMAVWWITVHYDAKVVLTAPTSGQLHDALLPEMKGWIRAMPGKFSTMYTIKQDRIEWATDPERNFISAKTSRAEQPDAMAGVHAKHVLLVGDEASGIPDTVYEYSGGSMSSEHATMLLAGNPVRSTGYFYDTHTRLADAWTIFKVSCVDSERVSRKYIEECELRYGIDSNAYRVRVLGEFPVGDDDTVIPISLIEGAMGRDVEVEPHAPIVWGVDVARFGSDASALAKRKGNVLLEPVRLWKGKDTMQVVGAVKAEWDGLLPSQRPEEIMVDSIGLGAGVVDRLRELELPARGINVSESPAMGATYLNLRSELWYKARAWFERRDTKITDEKDRRLVTELATVRFAYTSLGKIKIESKDDIRRRGLPSPDAADAFMLTFASDAGVALFGHKRRRKGPLLRRIKGII